MHERPDTLQFLMESQTRFTDFFLAESLVQRIGKFVDERFGTDVRGDRWLARSVFGITMSYLPHGLGFAATFVARTAGMGFESRNRNWANDSCGI